MMDPNYQPEIDPLLREPVIDLWLTCGTEPMTHTATPVAHETGRIINGIQMQLLNDHGYPTSMVPVKGHHNIWCLLMHSAHKNNIQLRKIQAILRNRQIL